jgi:hypothetical protein
MYTYNLFTCADARIRYRVGPVLERKDIDFGVTLTGSIVNLI